MSKVLTGCSFKGWIGVGSFKGIAGTVSSLDNGTVGCSKDLGGYFSQDKGSFKKMKRS